MKAGTDQEQHEIGDLELVGDSRVPVFTRLNLPIVPLRHQAAPFEDLQVTDQLDPERFVLVRVAVEQADRGGSFGFAHLS